jgi:hypothetical protein
VRLYAENVDVVTRGGLKCVLSEPRTSALPSGSGCVVRRPQGFPKSHGAYVS